MSSKIISPLDINAYNFSQIIILLKLKKFGNIYTSYEYFISILNNYKVMIYQEPDITNYSNHSKMSKFPAVLLNKINAFENVNSFLTNLLTVKLTAVVMREN